jgi:hypothetical protein
MARPAHGRWGGGAVQLHAFALSSVLRVLVHSVCDSSARVLPRMEPSLLRDFAARRAISMYLYAPATSPPTALSNPSLRSFSLACPITRCTFSRVVASHEHGKVVAGMAMSGGAGAILLHMRGGQGGGLAARLLDGDITVDKNDAARRRTLRQKHRERKLSRHERSLQVWSCCLVECLCTVSIPAGILFLDFCGAWVPGCKSVPDRLMSVLSDSSKAV